MTTDLNEIEGFKGKEVRKVNQNLLIQSQDEHQSAIAFTEKKSIVESPTKKVVRFGNSGNELYSYMNVELNDTP